MVKTNMNVPDKHVPGHIKNKTTGAYNWSLRDGGCYDKK